MSSHEHGAMFGSVDGSTLVYGVIGNPIAHTLSPLLHNAVFKKRNINAVFLPFNVKEDELPLAMEGLKALGIAGVNITVPHKQQAVHYVDAMIRPIDKAVGAINTLVFSEGRMLGANTDGMGFIEDLARQFKFKAEGASVLVLGAGGASRALAFALIEGQVKHLYIYNRTLDRGRGLVEYLKKYFPEKKISIVESVEDFKEKKVDLIVNGTSCGMKDEDPFPINPDILKHTTLYYDLIYNPHQTKMVKEAIANGVVAVGGIGMLICQAVIAHRFWFPDAKKEELYEIMSEAYQTWHGSL